MMGPSLRAVACLLLAMARRLSGACPDPRRWPGHPVYNSSADYVRPRGRRVVTVLGSADPVSVSRYGSVVAPLFQAFRATSQLSFLMGGCSGLMGSPTPFCTEGALGEACNIYDGFWTMRRPDSRPQGDEHCIQDCEWHHGMKVHLVASRAVEEEIITGGAGGKGDALLVLPGGIGTTRELYDVLQANFEYRDVNKPIFCLDAGGFEGPLAGFYGGVVRWLEQLYSDKLLKPYPGSSGSSLFISSSPDLLAAAIDAWAVSGELPEEMRLEHLINITGIGDRGALLV